MTNTQKHPRNMSRTDLGYACVLATGVFCCSDCSLRMAHRTAVYSVSTIKEALSKGFRPCRHCRSIDSKNHPPVMRRLLDDIQAHPAQNITQQALRQYGVDPKTVRDWFLTQYGMSFTEYQRMMRINHAFKVRNNGAALMDTVVTHGFESLGELSEVRSQNNSLATTTKQDDPLYLYRFETLLGTMLAGATRDGLCLLEFLDRKMIEPEIRQFALRYRNVVVCAKNAHIEATIVQINEYFAGTRTVFDIPLIEYGTSFQKSAWHALRTIPYGQTYTYTQQAVHTASPQAVRATASANGRNTIAIVTPCHRVIGNDGVMAGYGGGVWRKQWLIEYEKQHSV